MAVQEPTKVIHGPPASLWPDIGPGCGGSLKNLLGLIYFPHHTTFVPVGCNIHLGSAVPPTTAATASQMQITGHFMDGHRPRQTSSDNFTHILLVDPTFTINDAYRGNGQPSNRSTSTMIHIPSMDTNAAVAYFDVIFQFVTIIPGVGRKRVLLCDQRSLFIRLKDIFFDNVGVDLSVHTMDVGPGWTILTGTLQIPNNRCQATVAPAYAIANATQAGVNAFLTVNVQDNDSAGLTLRRSDASNGWDIVLDTTTFRIIEHNAGVYTVRASTTLSLIAGTDHPLQVTMSGQSILAILDTTTQISYGAATLNQTVTNHGIYQATTLTQLNNFIVTQL